MAASIDYGMPFCKSCFNLEGDADGLSFVTGEEIKKLERMICDINPIEIFRTKKASEIAEKLMSPIITLQTSMITEKEAELSVIENELVNNVVNVDNLSQRSLAEDDVLVIDDKVTLTRRVGRSRVKGKVMAVNTTYKGEVTYDVQPQNGAVFYNNQNIQW